MRSGSAAAAASQPAKQHETPTVRLTLHCWLVGVVGCMGGLSFGYEGPVVSGLIVQPAFLHTFHGASPKAGSSYCKLNSVALQLYISCSFITAALATAVAASGGVDRFGRKQFILAASLLIVTANVLQIAATGRAMLIAGRLIMGLGQGCATFTVPMYVAEMSPAPVRGRLGTVYSIATTVGQLLAFAVNQAVYASGLENGWRISFAAVAWCPVVMLLLLLFVLPDTPSSLLQRGLLSRAKSSFNMVRHSSSHGRDREWQGMCNEAHRVVATKKQQQGGQHKRWNLLHAKHAAPAAPAAADATECDAAAAVSDTAAAAADADAEQGLHAVDGKNPDSGGPSKLDSSHSSKTTSIAGSASQGGTGSPWPALIIMLHLTVLRSFNGFVNIMYFTALLFSSTGNSTRNSLLAQTLMGVSTLLGGCAAMMGIDKIGRQPLLAWMGLAMAALMAAAAAILGTGLPPSAAAAGTVLSPTSTALLLVVLCLWQMSFWSSWGPCFYVVLSELYPLQSRARSVGWGMVTFNLGVVLVLSLGGTMLCAMSYGLLIFFAGVNLCLALFAATCMPETKATGLHEVGEVYRNHWLWKHAYRTQ